MRESETGRGRSWTELWVWEKAGLSLVPREPRSVNWTRVVLGGRVLGLYAPRQSVTGAVGRLPPLRTAVPDVSNAHGFHP